jgi:hypothetical protein
MTTLRCEINGHFKPEHLPQVEQFQNQILLAGGQATVSAKEGVIYLRASWSESLELVDMAKHLEQLNPGHVSVTTDQALI